MCDKELNMSDKLQHKRRSGKILDEIKKEIWHAGRDCELHKE